MAAAFDAEYGRRARQAAKPGDARDADERTAAGGLHRCDERAKRVDHPEDVRVEDRAERRQVLVMLGQRAPRDAGVGDDDLGHAEPRDEIRRCASERIGVAHIALVHRRATSRQRRGQSVELGATAREQSDRPAVALRIAARARHRGRCWRR